MEWVKLSLASDAGAPGPRSSHSLNAVGCKLYAFGGEVESRLPVGSAVHVFDMVTRTWSAVEATGDIPSPRVAHSCCTYGTDLYVFGGRSGKEMGEGAQADLYRFDTQAGKWAQLVAAGPTPPQRSFHTACIAAGKMYVFGGCGVSGRLNDLWCYDFEAQAWDQMPTMDKIKGRGGSSLIPSPDGSTLWVVGGFAGVELGDMYSFSTAKRAWAEVPASGLPARSVFGAAVHVCPGNASVCSHAGHLVAFGGEVDPSTQGHAGAGDFSDDLFCWDAEQGWHKLEPSGDERPCARGWFAAAALPATGDLVVHGGLDCANNRLGDMFLLKAHGGGPQCSHH